MIEISTYLYLFVAGLLITISPCILPVLPIMLSSGLSKNKLAPIQTGLGLAFGFAILGVLLSLATQALGLSPNVSQIFFGSLMGLAGIVILLPASTANFKFLNQLAEVSNKLSQNAEKLPGGNFYLGILLGGIWSPCIGPLLGAAFSLTGAKSTVFQAGVQMFTFGIGAALPLVLVAYFLKQNARKYLPKVAEGGKLGRQILGVVLVLVSLFVLTGLDVKAMEVLTEILPEGWIDLSNRI